MSTDLRPLPARLTESAVRAASPEQRAAWLKEAEATAPARAARLRETIAEIEQAAPPAPAKPLPVGEDRESLVRLYEAWQDAQVAAGGQVCDHGESLARTCVRCFDARIWERVSAPVPVVDLDAVPTKTAAEERYAAAEAQWRKSGSGADEDAMISAGQAMMREQAKAAHPSMQAAITDISLSLQDAGATFEEEANEEAERLADLVAAAAVAPVVARLDELAARVKALEDRPPVIAPPAVPADLAARIAVAEGVADTARKAVEALAGRVASLAVPAPTVTAGPTATVQTAPPTPHRTIRCSALPLFRSCAASADRTPEMIRIESEGEPARLGTALHEVAAHMIHHGREESHWMIPQVAERHDVDADDLGYLAHQAGEAWEVLRERFPRPSVEAELSTEIARGVRLTGHPDVSAVDGRTLRILDWKSGRARYDAREQVIGYAVQVYDDLPPEADGIETVEVYVAWLRDGDIERLTFSTGDVNRWSEDLGIRASETPLPFSPGPHCVQCARCADCPAKAAWVRQAVAEFAPGGTTAEALAAARAVAKAAKQAIEAIRVQAITTGIDGIATTEERRVSVRLGHPAVRTELREALAGEATASGSKVRSAMFKVLGLKGAEADEEMARLEAAGAAKVTKSIKVGEE